jgi:hypothetical protein
VTERHICMCRCSATAALGSMLRGRGRCGMHVVQPAPSACKLSGLYVCTLEGRRGRSCMLADEERANNPPQPRPRAHAYAR